MSLNLTYSTNGWSGWKNTSTHILSPTLSVVYCMTGKCCIVKTLLNYGLCRHHGNLQLEEEDAVEGVAHGPGEEEVAEQVKVGLQALFLVVQSDGIRL